MRLMTALLAATALTGASASMATELEVTHWWTSGGEAAAVAEFAKAFDASGDKWIDGAIAGSGGTARPIIISRILGGDPMGATQLNHGRQAEEQNQFLQNIHYFSPDVQDRTIPLFLLNSCTKTAIWRGL